MLGNASRLIHSCRRHRTSTGRHHSLVADPYPRRHTRRLATMKLDPSIASLLAIDPSDASVSTAGGGGMSSASTAKITVKHSDGSTRYFFMKTGSGSEAEVMFAGEHASLNALASAVPNLAPRSYGHGRLSGQYGKSFLVTEFLDLSSRRSVSSKNGESLAKKLARLHSKPAPVPDGHDEAQFGFPVPTCCGDTPQKNTYSHSWADFYANNRLRFISDQSRKSNGEDAALDKLVERTCREIVPRLIGDHHLNGGNGVTPVVVHGDLWSGNAGVGILSGMSEPEEIVYDPSACYAHSEFELGIMKMFGGFGASFLTDYHKLCPKTEPTNEYDDRVALYELYHHLNHHALFGGGYRSGAVGIMQSLLKKYGSGGKTEL